MSKQKIITKLSDGTNLELSLKDAEAVEKNVRMFYFRQDVVNYFIEHSNYKKQILDDEEVINDVTRTYYDYRYDADGGERESAMHWSDCLIAAIEDCQVILRPYKHYDESEDTN